MIFTLVYTYSVSFLPPCEWWLVRENSSFCVLNGFLKIGTTLNWHLLYARSCCKCKWNLHLVKPCKWNLHLVAVGENLTRGLEQSEASCFLLRSLMTNWHCPSTVFNLLIQWNYSYTQCLKLLVARTIWLQTILTCKRSLQWICILKYTSGGGLRSPIACTYLCEQMVRSKKLVAVKVWVEISGR